MSSPLFALGVVRAHRWSAGCSADHALYKDEVDFFLPADESLSSSSSSSSPDEQFPALVTKTDLLACGRTLIASLGNSGSAAAAGGGGTGGGGGAVTSRGIRLDGNDDDDLDGDEVDDEEEEIFNRDTDAIGFRDLNLGHTDDVHATATKKLLSSVMGRVDESGVFFHLPKTHAKWLSVMGIAVPDPKFKRNYYVQQEVRFLVLFTNVPFHAYVRSKLAQIAVEFFAQDETLITYEMLSGFYRSLHTQINFAELPYREIYVGLPIVALVKRLGKDIIAALRVLLLEGRIVCYSSNPSIASSATLGLLALLPGVLSIASSEFTSRTIQAVVYRLRRYGMPFSLFNEDFMLQPCFTSDQEREVYATKGFLVGTSNPLLLKHPKAHLDLIVNLDLHQVVTFPTKKTELAFAFGSATAAFADSIAERFGRNVSGSSSMHLKEKKSATTDMKTSLVRQKSLSGASMQSAHSDIDWVLGQFQMYFEHFLEEGFRSLFGGSGGVDVTQDPYHPSIRSLLEDLAKPVFGEHAKFYAEYGRAWTHAWQTTNNYDNWVGAHRLERRRSTIATPTPPPQEGHGDYTYPNGDEYEGMFQNGKRNGFGVYVEFVTKNQYEGDWKDDKRHGKGVLSSKQHGYIYDGDWKDDMRCGRGHSSLKNVESYTGEWVDNCFHGVGIYTNAEGDIYDGEWRAGVKEGVGKLTVARTQRDAEFGGLKQYSGEWAKGKFHGTGTAHYMDETEYSGGFQDGKRHGNGTLVLASGDTYEGQWWKGYRHGEGASHSAKSGTTKEGTWKKDCEVDGGEWFLVYQNGDKYTGECRRGRPWGDGICKYANQSSYSGSWVDGLREGFGICVNADGTILEGEWKNSVYVKPVKRPSRFVDIPLTAGTTSSSSSQTRSGAPPPSSSESGSTHERKRMLSVFSQQHPESGSHVHVYPNGDSYDGAFANFMRHGFGVFTERATGNVYEGEWQQNVRQGSGVLTSGMKDFIYDGAWDQDVRSGYGHCVIRGCETYSGHWKNNQFQGVGKYIDAEGHVYEGEFVNGKKHGVGKQVFASVPAKEQYSGEWRDGYRDGIGDAVFADGSTYSGSWRKDLRDGEGTFVAAGTGDRYVGQWRNGMKDGAGILHVASTGVVKEGMWTQDEPIDGEWTIQFPDGSKFTGMCVKSRPHGRGVCKYANGDLYDGQWVSGKRHGVGTGFFANGEGFVGEWENNHVALNGKGRLTLADGTVHVYSK